MAESLLYKINNELKKMGKAERRVAEIVRNKPSLAIKMNMASLAKASEVSDPTIVRFFRRFGFKGYSEFKMRLAQDLVPSAPFSYEAIRSGDTATEVARKTCHNSINAIQRALQDLSVPELEAATRTLRGANWIGIVGAGMSEIVALDAEHKFERLGLRCNAVIRASRQLALAREARRGDVILIFSQSGATKRLVEMAREVTERGAATVAVTAPASPLANVATHCVGVIPYEHMETMTPLASRLNHQLLVNMLVSTISISSGMEFPDQLPALDFWVTEKI